MERTADQNERLGGIVPIASPRKAVDAVFQHAPQESSVPKIEAARDSIEPINVPSHTEQRKLVDIESALGKFVERATEPLTMRVHLETLLRQGVVQKCELPTGSGERITQYYLPAEDLARPPYRVAEMYTPAGRHAPTEYRLWTYHADGSLFESVHRQGRHMLTQTADRGAYA